MIMKLVYLDSRDLIQIVSKDAPMPPIDIAALLIAKQWQLVYSFANICEVVVIDELLETRRRLQVLGQIPHTYISNPQQIKCQELLVAVEAFQSGCDLRSINPFVSRWHYTYSLLGQPYHQNLLVNYTLADQVLSLVMKNRAVFRNHPEAALLLQDAVDEDRKVRDAERRNRARFEGNVKQVLLDCRIPILDASLKDFARWIRADPLRCPSWQMFNEAYLEFCTNAQDQIDKGDIPDYSHIMSLPYVEAITLDRRMAGYARAAALKLFNRNPKIAYLDRIFPDTEAWLQSL